MMNFRGMNNILPTIIDRKHLTGGTHEMEHGHLKNSDEVGKDAFLV
jgi:hypothetical protein